MANSGHIEVAQAYVTIIPSMKDAQKTISEGLSAAAAKAGDEAGKKAGEGISKGTESGSTKAAGAFSKAFSDASAKMSGEVTSKMGSMASSIGSTFSDLGDRFQQNFPKLSTLPDTVGKALSNVASKAGTAFGSVSGAAKGSVDFIKGKFPNATSAASAALDKLKDAGGKALSKVGDLATTAFDKLKKAAAVGVAAATASITALGKVALDGYADYEQLSGGVQKLFGEEAAKTIMANAQQAYQTAGMSANQYMEQATTFSAALIKGLNGDTAEAARLTDVAIRAMSDNVNTFGTDAQSVQDAFNGFAKQNYTMLDNLKLGYAGTKQGMVDLVKDSGVLGDAARDLTVANLDEMVSFGQIVEAIQAVQEQQGIAGTTAKEAASTISGSVEMAKSAWSNWLTELGKDEADMGARTQELVESVGTAAGNIVPRVAEIAGAVIESLPGLLAQVGSTLKEQIVPMLDEVTGGAASRVLEVLEPLAVRLGDAFGAFGERMSGLAPVVEEIAGKLGEGLAWAADLATGAVEALLPVVASIAEAALPALSGALDVVLPVIEGVVDAAMRFAGALLEALQPAIDAVGPLLQALGDMLTQVGGWISDNVVPVVGDLAEALGGLLGGAISIVTEAFSGLLDFLKPIGDAIGGVAETIGGAWDWLTGQIVQDGTSMESAVQVSTAGMASTAKANASSAKSAVSKEWEQLKSSTESSYSSVSRTVSTRMREAKDSATGAASGITGGVSSSWEELRSKTESTYSAAKGTIDSSMREAASSAESSASALAGSVSSSFEQAKDSADSSFRSLHSVVQSKMTDTLSTARLNAEQMAVSLRFESIADTADAAFQGVSGAANKEMDRAREYVSNGVDEMRSLLDVTLDMPSFNPSYMPLPHFWMDGVFNPDTGQVPSVGVDWYFRGGFVDGATLIGVGERGGELVWPSYGPYLDRYADALARSMDGRGGRGGVDIHDCTFNVRKESDIRKTAELLDTLAERRASGALA